MSKNIAIIVYDISKSAGTERAVTNLANLLSCYGDYNIIIISLYTNNNDSCYYKLNNDVIIEHLDIGKKNKIAFYLEYITKLKLVIRSNHIDTVIGTTHALNSLMIFLNRKVKRIACEHLNYDSCPKFSSIIRRVCYKHLDKIILLTKSDREKYSFISDKKRVVIPNSLSFTTEEPAKLTKKRIIAIGRLTNQKGFDYLLRIISLLKSDMEDWIFDIFGDGEEYCNLNNEIERLKIQNFVRINKPTKEIQKELNESSIYVMTSRFEGLPMVLLEAMACGLPIISFDCPEGPADLVMDEENGFLVEMANCELFANKLKLLMDNYELRRSYGFKSYEFSKNYSPENIFKEWEKVL